VIEEAAPSADIPPGAHAIVLPVMAIEGMDTADGRYLEPGAISHRALPITLFAQVRTPDGGDGHDNAYIVGAVTEMVRRPGPEVIQKSTGLPFPEGTFVWSGTKAWMYGDVPSAPDKSAYELVRDRALSGNSIDLSDVVAAYEFAPGEEDDPEARPIRVRMQQGVIAATTLVGQPAFPDAYVELDGELVRVTISDNGPPFDPLAFADPDTALSVEEREIGGLGIHLVRQMMDEVSYQRRDGENVVVLAKRLREGTTGDQRGGNQMDVRTRTEGEVTIIAFAGNLDSNTSPAAQQAIDGILAGGAKKMVVDFSALDYISSAGLRVLLGAAKKLQPPAGGLRLFGLNETVREVFEISGFAKILQLRASEAEAMEGL
jgi:anti-anti-sigma factor